MGVVQVELPNLLPAAEMEITGTTLPGVVIHVDQHIDKNCLIHVQL